MKVEVDLTEYGVKAPKWYDPINPHVINASGGGGSSNDVELTWEEYEALSEEEKMNGNNYFITDIGNPKSLVKKTIIDTPLQSTETIYNLSDSYKNYDYVIVFITDGANAFIRASSVIYTNAFNSGSVDYTTWTTDAGRTDKWRASASFKFMSDTTIRIYDVFQDPSAWEGGPFTPTNSKLLIVGYRYERVVVPNQMVNYSTVEARIGTWIDGKPLYQKTYNHTFGSTSATENITTFTNEDVVSISGIIDNGTTKLPIPWTESSIYCRVNIDNKVLKIVRASSGHWDGKSAYITIQYTKTTD